MEDSKWYITKEFINKNYETDLKVYFEDTWREGVFARYLFPVSMWLVTPYDTKEEAESKKKELESLTQKKYRCFKGTCVTQISDSELRKKQKRGLIK